MKESILGFDVTTKGKDECLDFVKKSYKKDESLFIVNINPEIIINNYHNESLKKSFNEQQLQIPDGIGIVKASLLLGGNIKERITGIDFMDKLCALSCEIDAKVYLYGSKNDISKLAKENLEKKYPKIKIVGYKNGYVSEEEAYNDIKKVKPTIVFVGLGSPKQENFILKYKEKLPFVKVWMPVGGSFDVISGSIKRAPSFFINHNIEWFYRLLKQPKRIFRQSSLFKFMALVKKEKKKQ